MFWFFIFPVTFFIKGTYLKFIPIFWEGHNFLRNLHRRFVPCSNSQIYGGDFAKFCGHLRIYELYRMHCIYVVFCAAYSVLFYQKYSNVLKRCYSLLLTWKILNPSYIVTWLSKHVVVPMINVSICKLFVLKRRFAVLGTLAICFVFSSLFSNFVVSYFLHANKSLWIIHIFASNNNHPDHHRFANLKINEKKKLTFYFGVLLFLTYILLHYILILNLWFISFFVSMICNVLSTYYVSSKRNFVKLPNLEIATLLNTDTQVPSISFYPAFIQIF